MKNFIIFILAVTTIIAGYMVATAKLRLGIEGVEGKTEKVIRGDLTIPINATGEVRPGLRVEIKSEASGEVIEIARYAGDRVTKGDLLIRLQPDDEQRSVNRAKQELQIAESRMNAARITFEQAKGADLQVAQARLDQLAPSVEMALFRKDKIERMDAGLTNDEEILQRKTTYDTQLAQLQEAKATLERAKLAIPRAEQEFQSAEASFEAAKATVGDAEKRLAKTTIRSPITGVVGEVRAQIGEVVQGGKTTLTGGTVLAVILDLEKIIVRAEVDESDVGRVLAIAPDWATPGHAAAAQMPEDLTAASKLMENLPEITVESFREDSFTGVIERIFPEPRSITNVVTYLVDVVVISENKSRLLPGMRADVSFTSEHVTNVLLCPNEAIKEGPRGKLGVFVPKPGAPREEHATEFVDCVFGLDNGTYSEIRQGLTEGAVVYTRLPNKSDKDKEKEKKERKEG